MNMSLFVACYKSSLFNFKTHDQKIKITQPIKEALAIHNVSLEHRWNDAIKIVLKEVPCASRARFTLVHFLEVRAKGRRELIQFFMFARNK